MDEKSINAAAPDPRIALGKLTKKALIEALLAAQNSAGVFQERNHAKDAELYHLRKSEQELTRQKERAVEERREMSDSACKLQQHVDSLDIFVRSESVPTVGWLKEFTSQARGYYTYHQGGGGSLRELHSLCDLGR